MKFDLTVKVDLDDNSILRINIKPFTDGDFYVHAFIGSREINKSG